MRGRPARALGRRSARSASAGACRSRSSAGSPTTATSRSSRAGWTPTAGRAGRARAGADPGRALTSDAIVHERVAHAAHAPPRRARPRARPTTPSDRLPERGMDPGAVLLALLGSAEPRLAPRGLRAVRLDGRGRHRRRARVTARRSCGSRARPRRSSRRPTATRPSARSTRGSGAALSVAEATRNVSITGARPLGVTNCLNYGDPTRPEAFWQLTEGVRGLGDACRALGLPVTGGNVSLYNESPAGADRADARDRRRRPARRHRARCVGPAFAAARRRDRARRRGDARAWPARPTRRSPATPPRTARRRSTSRARRRSRRSSARRSRAASSPPPRTSRAAGWPSPSPSARCGAGSARASASPVAHSPAVELFGESPSRLVVTCRPRYAPALDAARPPARPAGRDARRRSAATGWSSSSPGPARRARPRSAAAASPTRSRSRSPTCATPGTTASPARSAGRADRMCGVFGAVLPRRRADGGRRDRGARPVRAPAPRPGVGRPRGQRRRAADALQGPRDDQHGPRRAAPAEPARPASRSPTAATRRPARRSGRTPSRRTGWGRAGRSRSATTATSSTRASCSSQLRGGRARLPASTDTELLTALLADEPAADTVEALRPGPAARPRRVQPRRPRRAAGHRRARPARVPAARPRPAAATARGRAARTTACGATTTPRPAGASRRRRPASTSSAPSTSATSSPARSSSSSRARRRAPSASPRRRPRCASSSSSTSPGPTRTWRAATCTRSAGGWAMQLADRAPGRRRPRDARARHRRPGRGRLRRGVAACRTARGCTATATPAGPSSSRRPGAAPPGRDDQAQPAARGRPRQAPDRRRRLDRARARRPSGSSSCCARPAPTEVHVRISAPPIYHPCFYGIDTQIETELIASTHTEPTRSASSSAPTRSATCRSAACSPRSTCRTSGSASPASTATTRSPCRTTRRAASSCSRSRSPARD